MPNFVDSLVASMRGPPTKEEIEIALAAMTKAKFPSSVWAALPCSDGMNDASITEYGVVRGMSTNAVPLTIDIQLDIEVLSP